MFLARGRGATKAQENPDNRPLVARLFDDLALQLRMICWIGILVMVPVVLYFTTLGTWDLTRQRNDGGWSGGFYAAQAESMLVRARLDVEPPDIQGECFERDSRCYGYFGLTPTLVRIPLLGISRSLHSAMTPI